jgi:hypothetical protein
MQPSTRVLPEQTDLRPDENWLLGVHQVAGHAWRRGCEVIYNSDLALDITHPDQDTRKAVVVTATYRGRWSLINVLAACSEATGHRPYVVDPTKIRLQNPAGIDELWIAKLIAADGIPPYRRPPRNHWWTPCMARVMEIRDGALPRTSHQIYDFRRCVRTLNDVGLLTTKFGRNGGLYSASHSWLPRAYLPAKPEPTPEIDQEDEWALRGIAL